MFNKTPIFNLHAVLKETNLKADVLRAWERRYGLPKPDRTPGGHRLYSEYDIATIKWLRARQDEGLSISRAVELWKEISETGRDPLTGGDSPLAGMEQKTAGADTNLMDMLRSDWLSACLAFDASRAEDLITQAFAVYPVETVCLEILQKGISQIGHLWYEGRASVQQEHFATALAMRRIEALIITTPQPTQALTILTGCPEGEWHSFPVLLLTLLLRRKGLNVIYLGADIPIEQMNQTTAAIRPNLIVLAGQQLRSAAAIRSAAVMFRKADFPMAYGGLIFNRIPELRERIPAFFLGEDLAGAVERIEQLATTSAVFPFDIPVDDTCVETAAGFREYLSRIDTALMDLLKEEGLTFREVAAVNLYFAAAITAALELGNLRFLEPDLDWLVNLLKDRGIPAETLYPYLAAYRKAVQQVMGDEGAVISDWLASNLVKNHGT